MSYICKRLISDVVAILTFFLLATTTTSSSATATMSPSSILNKMNDRFSTNDGILKKNDQHKNSYDTIEVNGVNGNNKVLHTVIADNMIRGGDSSSSLSKSSQINMILNDLHNKYHHQPLFLQAVEEMILSIDEILMESSLYRQAFAILTEPERTISFRITWMDDQGVLQINRGWRIEFNSALGPYKGGLRFHPSVDEGTLKFLAFEQIFKNALTGLPLGGGKGGSDFNPKGKSDGEIRRFCEAYMNELYRYINPSTDVPAGDIGVGTREIGYLYGQYKRLTNRHGDGGVLTGKSLLIGGSPLRTEATGYGLIYMTQIAFQKQFNRSLKDVRCAVSGSGNVAQYAVQKLIQLGACVVTMSDSNGVLVFDDGMSMEDLNVIMECKNIRRGRLSSLTDKIAKCRFMSEASPWTLLPTIKYEIALPCATQNEILAEHASRMVSSGVIGVLEGANLPTNMEAQEILRKANILYIPGKASNAGGVGVSGLEMSQNAQRLVWSSEDVDNKLQEMMSHIYSQMTEQQSISISNDPNKSCTLEQGANRAGFIKVANAMKDLGWLY